MRTMYSQIVEETGGDTTTKLTISKTVRMRVLISLLKMDAVTSCH